MIQIRQYNKTKTPTIKGLEIVIYIYYLSYSNFESKLASSSKQSIMQSELALDNQF